ncbi:MAG: FISUMP domain-containing protein [Saprospiraceae bacterium]
MKSNVTNTSAGVGLGWDPGNPGTNTSGFSALPGGYRTDSGSFGGVRGGAFLWSATENSLISNSAWYRDLGNGWTGVGRGFFTKSFGASVRCLKD